mgnify:CR=1 FL=1
MVEETRKKKEMEAEKDDDEDEEDKKEETKAVEEKKDVQLYSPSVPKTLGVIGAVLGFMLLSKTGRKAPAPEPSSCPYMIYK